MGYIVGDKFVIEIKEIDELNNHLILENTAVGTDMLDKLERLDSDYVNEHYGELQDEAYNKGLEDAWELAKKLWHNDAEKNDGIYGIGYFIDIANEYTPQEALAKLEAYEKKEQAKIKVGDVVTDKEHEVEILVTIIYTTHFDGIKVNADNECGKFGATYSGMCIRDFEKTGKHIDIQSVLQQIGGAE